MQEGVNRFLRWGLMIGVILQDVAGVCPDLARVEGIASGRRMA